MDYAEQLQKIPWQQRRLKIMERDGWKCQSTCCKKPDTEILNVHHKYYLSFDPNECTDDMLITLCPDCHKAENYRGKAELYLLQTLSSKGFLISDLMAFSAKLETNQAFTDTLLNILRKFQSK